VSTDEGNRNAISEHIRHQLGEDMAHEQMTFKENIAPFTGGKNDWTANIVSAIN
jgi:hypothetical protein